MKKYAVRLVDDTLEITFAGMLFADDVMDLKADVMKLSQDGPHDILVNMAGMPGETKVPGNVGEYFKDLPFKRYAIFGGAQPIMLPLKEVVDSLANHPNLKFFRNEEDAREWLESGK